MQQLYVIQYLFYFDLNSLHLEEDEHNTWRDVVRSAAAALQLNWMERLCMVLHVWPVKDQLRLLHEAASLSGGPRVDRTQLSPLFRGQEKRWLRVSPSFFFLLSKTTKMENNRRVIPASPGGLDKERSSGSQTSKAVFRTYAAAQRPLLSLHSHYS